MFLTTTTKTVTKRNPFIAAHNHNRLSQIHYFARGDKRRQLQEHLGLLGHYGTTTKFTAATALLWIRRTSFVSSLLHHIPTVKAASTFVPWKVSTVLYSTSSSSSISSSPSSKGNTKFAVPMENSDVNNKNPSPSSADDPHSEYERWVRRYVPVCFANGLFSVVPRLRQVWLCFWFQSK